MSEFKIGDVVYYWCNGGHLVDEIIHSMDRTKIKTQTGVFLTACEYFASRIDAIEYMKEYLWELDDERNIP